MSLPPPIRITRPDPNTEAKAPHMRALARAKLLLMQSPDSVFFMALAFSMRHRFTDQIPTAATDGTTVWYNPAFFLKLTAGQQLFVLLHESLHVAYLHMLRVGKRDKQRWNWAADFVVNWQLKARGFEVPEFALCDPQYAGMSAEQVYDLLPEAITITIALDDLFAIQGPRDANGDPKPGPKGPRGPNGRLFTPNVVPGEGDSVDSAGDNGSGSPGAAVGSDPADLEREIQDILVRAALQSKMAGDKAGAIPGDIEIFLDRLLHPKLPWHRILRQYLSHYAKTDYSFRRPNRRFFPKHLLPSLHGQALMDIGIAVDTSGSVSDQDFRQMVSEVHAILVALKPRSIHLAQFDSVIQASDRIKNASDLMKVTFHGRGGTRIAPVMEWARETGVRLLLVFTDADFQDRVPEPAPCDVVWLVHGGHGDPLPFGKRIEYQVETP